MPAAISNDCISVIEVLTLSLLAFERSGGRPPDPGADWLLIARGGSAHAFIETTTVDSR